MQFCCFFAPKIQKTKKETKTEAVVVYKVVRPHKVTSEWTLWAHADRCWESVSSDTAKQTRHAELWRKAASARHSLHRHGDQSRTAPTRRARIQDVTMWTPKMGQFQMVWDQFSKNVRSRSRSSPESRERTCGTLGVLQYTRWRCAVSHSPDGEGEEV